MVYTVQCRLRGERMICLNLEGNETEQIKVPMMLSKSEDIGFGTIGNEIFETLAEVIHIPYISGKFRIALTCVGLFLS